MKCLLADDSHVISNLICHGIQEAYHKICCMMQLCLARLIKPVRTLKILYEKYQNFSKIKIPYKTKPNCHSKRKISPIIFTAVCLAYTLNVLKFWTLVACQKKPRKKLGTIRSGCIWRSVCACYWDKHLVNSSPGSQHFIWDQKEKSVQNFWIFTNFSIHITASKNFRPKILHKILRFSLIFFILNLKIHCHIYLYFYNIVSSYNSVSTRCSNFLSSCWIAAGRSSPTCSSK